ncbi:MAG: DUF6220 domain-containing protein [Candidatus Limnocylindrales bacterium]
MASNALRGLAGRLYPWLLWLFVLSVLAQIFFAGMALFGATSGFGLHRDFGYSVPGIIALVVLLAAVAGGLGRNTILWSAGLLVLYIVQTTLPVLRDSMPMVAALHPLNAMLLLAIAVWLARRRVRS